METHIKILNELKTYAGKNSKETRDFVQFACCLIDSKGNKYFGVTSFPDVDDMQDKAKKMIRSRYAPMNAGELYLEANRSIEERKLNPITTVYTYPSIPCGVDIHRYSYMGPEIHIVFPEHPEQLKGSWVNVKESLDTVMHKMIKSNMSFTYIPRRHLEWED